MTLSSEMSVVTSCVSVNERIHSSSSNNFVAGFFSFFDNISCVLSRKRHSSGKSPIAHLIVRMSRHRNRRLIWPAPAKETMASRCSCRSPVGTDRSTHWRQFDVEQRSDACFAPSLLPHRAPRLQCIGSPVNPAQHLRPIPSWLC